MPAPDPRSGPYSAGVAAKASLPVLRVGCALAVLLDGVADDPAARTAAATSALRLAANRPDIAISRRESGRPRLAAPYRELAVSLSHRGQWLLAAFASDRDVGTDIEIDIPTLEPLLLARDHFAQTELHAIASLSDAAARDAFLRLWVAKEAALKVTGRGIHDGLGEPDLATHLPGLQQDGAGIALAASARLPALRIAVCRVTPGSGPVIYCGLAVAAAS